jgi:hypothetical protein
MRKLITTSAMAILLASLCFCTTIPVPPSAEDLQGAWIGMSPDVHDYYRLVLTNGRGAFARAFESEQPAVYRVDSYVVDQNGTFSTKMFQNSTNGYPISVTGLATHNRIRIDVSSPLGGWSHQVTLYREQTVHATLDRLKKSME